MNGQNSNNKDKTANNNPEQMEFPSAPFKKDETIKTV